MNLQTKYFFSITVLVLVFILFMTQTENGLFFKPTQVSVEKSEPNYQINQLINPTQNLNKSDYPTVFCLIKTHPNNIKSNKTLNAFRVWGHKCDNYRFVTLLPKHLKPKDESETVEVFENFYMIQPKGLVKESHGNLTLKLYYSMMYVYQKLPSYDWYYIVDDDAYVNVANLKEFLKDKSSNESITYGYNFKVIVKGGYHSGGPGYVLSNAAFTTINKAMVEKVANCPNTGTDDVDINACVRKYNGKLGKSADQNGRERFLVLSLMGHFLGHYPDWLRSYAENPLKKGFDCCADSIIAVHYMSPRDVFRLDLAIEIHKNVLKLYDKFQMLQKPVTFKNIIKNYILLEDIEYDRNKYKELINE
ncbi:glyco -N-acetylgalactosamine 3-beta-galactosyltransferase 1-like isoform X3 [Brachionus plicatilis]|uniref:Glyco-N-acetylgalactosamine 3-beta-galactosyltransferase 1-like isoform X3 n=1 Tax=Brachionus plicatilis TaxID=10195 RepID=A0A3M7QZR8_BRAPC|nr:glyco -N-acetylgalactosamine 3-beta-galactosyltransferase 1-like isoform X3 [Brachionus plicatilis]